MTDEPTSGSPAPMEGGGVYNRSSRVQAGGLATAIPWLAEAARHVPLAPAPLPLVIADYGSSEGRNSLLPVGAAIAALRRRTGAGRAISVVHTDLPGNDFSALFRAIGSDPDSYARNDGAVFPSAVGRSFYEQLLPTGGVTLGWTSWAVQWLSRTPMPVPDHVQVAYSRDRAVRAAFARQAAADWETFLTHRGREMWPGARLVVVTMALTEDGDFGYRGVLAAMHEALLGLVGEGVIGRHEAERMTIPTVGRGRAELEAPFSVGGRFAGLSIERLEVFLEEDRIWDDFERDGDAAAFGARWAAFSRASVFPTLAQGLDPGTDEARRRDFVARLETGMAARLAAAPAPSVIPLAGVVLVRAED